MDPSYAEAYPYVHSIVNTLDSVARLGSFANGGSFLLPLPVLQFSKVEGIARLPVSECEAKEIIAICSQAPYGRGEETIVDTTVRNTWQLNPSEFTIKNPQWDSHLENLAAVVKKELGCDPALAVKCELYKFLLYEQGSFFKPHHDTEKVANMFGTLVIQLPSDYDGGLLRVCHRGEEKTFNFSGLEGMSGFHYAAFYADCEHELCMVTRGYRLCLVYNLVYSGGDTCPAPIDYHQVSDQVIAAVTEWEQDDNSLPIMAYMLNHKYCEASLSFQHLKSTDRAVAEVLKEASKQKCFSLYLGIVTMTESLEIGCSNRYSLMTANSLVSPTGETINGTAEIVCNAALVPYDVFKDVKPDSEEVIPAGNEGDKLEKMYHHAALLMLPKKHCVVALGVLASIGVLESACNKLASFDNGSETAQLQRNECENLAKEITAKCKYLRMNKAITMMSCLQQLNSTKLIVQFLTIFLKSLWNVSHLSKIIIESCNTLGWEKFEQSLVNLFDHFCQSWNGLENSCTLLYKLTETSSISSQQLKVCQKLVDKIFHSLTNEQTQQSGNGCFSEEFVCELFEAFSVLQCEDQLELVLKRFFKQPEQYPVTTLALAAIELHESVAEGSRPLNLFMSLCVSTLQRLTQKEPDWSCSDVNMDRNDYNYNVDSVYYCQIVDELHKLSNIKCSCKLCAEVREFLMDPVKQVARFDVDSDRCDTSRKLASVSCVSCQEEVTSTAGQHTLVITKKQQLIDAKESDRQDKLKLLARISPLLEGMQENHLRRLKTTEDSESN